MDYSATPPEELFLTCLRAGEESAWLEFVRRFHPLIASVALRVARQWGETAPAVVDDLVQETYLKLCADRSRLLQNFQPTHEAAAYGYLKVFTANLAQDYLKALKAKKRGGASITGDLQVESGRDAPRDPEQPALELERKLLVDHVAACLEGAVSGPSAKRDRRIFWLYYRVGLSAREIAALPTIALTTKGVESIVFRLTRYVREQLVTRRVKSGRDKKMEEGIRPAESL